MMKFHRLAILLALATFTTAPTHAAKNTPTKGSVLIRNVHVVNANAQVSKQLLNVLVENGRISEIGTREFFAETVIDGNSQYLIPGLIDSHVHLRDVPGLNVPEHERATSKLYQEAAAQIPKSYLYAGFTTVLDLINTKDFINQWNSQPLAPQAYFCSPAFIPQGYPVAFLPKEIQDIPEISKQYLHDKHAHGASSIVDTDNHTPLKLVTAAKKDGALCIKAFYEKGFGKQRNLPVPSEAIMAELVATAHKQNLPVFLHGNSQWSYEFALKTGVDMIVHGLWNGDANTNKALPQIADRLVKAGIAFQPTVQVLYGEQESANPAFFEQPYVKHVMPAALINWYQSYEGQWMNREMASNFKSEATPSPAQRYQYVQGAYKPLLERVSLLVQKINAQNKSLLIFGSDTPSGPIYTQFPGLNGRMEMDRWIDMGVSLPDLFRAMTIGNAKRMGLDDDIGSIAKNKVANLLLLSKNPLEDITAYDSISWVVLKGKAVKREQLSAAKN